jgi:hypothetical protein
MWVLAVSSFGGFGALMVKALVDPSYREQQGDRYAFAASMLLFGVAFGLFFVRLGRIRLELREDMIVVVNPLRRYHIPRQAVVRLSVTSGGTWAVLVTTSARVPVLALSTGWRWTLRKRLETLNETLFGPQSA